MIKLISNLYECHRWKNDCGVTVIVIGRKDTVLMARRRTYEIH
jgi:hypothetical protein